MITPSKEGFRVNPNIRQQLANRKRRIQRRLDKTDLRGCARPMFTARNIHYEIADRTRGIASRRHRRLPRPGPALGLIDAIDQRLHLLKFHLPYPRIRPRPQLRLQRPVRRHLPARPRTPPQRRGLPRRPGARRIPDPTTAGDFCRRFRPADIRDACSTSSTTSASSVWAGQPDAFFDQATIDMDGTLVDTTGACKEGMDIAYDGTWGYHPLVLTLANTGEVLSMVNRPATGPRTKARPRRWTGPWRSASAAASATCCCAATPTSRRPNISTAGTPTRASASSSATTPWPNVKDRRGFAGSGLAAAGAAARYTVQTQPRRRPDNVKEGIVVAREFENLRLVSEDVAEFNYRPTACRQTYRMVVVRKNISVEKGERVLFDDVRYFFYITNDWVSEAAEIVFGANDRCNQENLLAQLQSGVRALRARWTTWRATGRTW